MNKYRVTGRDTLIAQTDVGKNSTRMRIGHAETDEYDDCGNYVLSSQRANHQDRRILTVTVSYSYSYSYIGNC